MRVSTYFVTIGSRCVWGSPGTSVSRRNSWLQTGQWRWQLVRHNAYLITKTTELRARNLSPPQNMKPFSWAMRKIMKSQARSILQQQNPLCQAAQNPKSDSSSELPERYLAQVVDVQGRVSQVRSSAFGRRRVPYESSDLGNFTVLQRRNTLRGLLLKCSFCLTQPRIQAHSNLKSEI